MTAINFPATAAAMAAEPTIPTSRDILERLLELTDSENPSRFTKFLDPNKMPTKDFMANVDEVRRLLRDAPMVIAREKALELQH